MERQKNQISALKSAIAAGERSGESNLSLHEIAAQVKKSREGGNNRKSPKQGVDSHTLHSQLAPAICVQGHGSDLGITILVMTLPISSCVASILLRTAGLLTGRTGQFARHRSAIASIGRPSGQGRR